MQAATVLLLTGTGFQTPFFDRIPAAHVYHSIAALNRTGQGFTARMIAAGKVAKGDVLAVAQVAGVMAGGRWLSRADIEARLNWYYREVMKPIQSLKP